MMSKIVFFNHFHKGDLHTHKEFIRHLQFELPDVTFEYMHNNVEKLTAELNIPLVGSPSELNNKEPFYYDEDTETLFINTWVGCNWDVFCKYGGNFNPNLIFCNSHSFKKSNNLLMKSLS